MISERPPCSMPKYDGKITLDRYMPGSLMTIYRLCVENGIDCVGIMRTDDRTEIFYRKVEWNSSR